MSEKVAYNETEVKTVKSFCDIYFWMLVLRRYFKVIFESNLSNDLPIINRAAHFFHDLSNILVDHFLLQAAKVMDRAQSFGKDNLSVYYIKERIQWPLEVKSQLKHLIEIMQKFNSHIRDARDRILSHNDLATILKGETLGQFPEGMDKTFLNALGEFAELTHRTCVGTPFNPIETFPGDAYDFVKILKSANAFDRYMEDNPQMKGELLLKYIMKDKEPECNVKK